MAIVVKVVNVFTKLTSETANVVLWHTSAVEKLGAQRQEFFIRVGLLIIMLLLSLTAFHILNKYFSFETSSM